MRGKLGFSVWAFIAAILVLLLAEGSEGARLCLTPVEGEGSVPGASSAVVRNALVAPEEPSAPKGGKRGSPLTGDALLPPERPMKDFGDPAGPFGAGFWDGSEYFLGRVGVAVIFVESQSADATEEWTAAEEDLVTSAIGEAADWWIARAPAGLLSCDFEFHYDVPVPCEPIEMNQGEEGRWIESALESLGFGSGDRFAATQRLLNDMKERRGLDWAFAIYVVDSSEDEDGMFADGYFAYAYLGGPYMVLTLDNDGWGIENFSSVCAHEMGHIFYALDQYYTARIPCDRPSGYLARENRNSQFGSCPEETPTCIMRSSHLSVATLSETARGQVGWIDSDGDGIPDVIDTAPAIRVASVGGDRVVRIEGTASISPLSNENPLGYGHAVSINVIDAVRFRVDGGPWKDASLDDGEEDDPSPPFVIETEPLEEGEHTLEIRAINSSRNATDPPFSLAVLSGGTGEEAKPLFAGASGIRILGNRPNPFNPSTEIQIEADIPGVVRVDLFDARGSLVRTAHDGPLPGGTTVVAWDGKDGQGRRAPSGRYFCRVTSGNRSVVSSMILIR